MLRQRVEKNPLGIYNLRGLIPVTCIFLALFDYVSRAHEIEIRPSSVRPSSVRVAIISESNAHISFKFWLLFPWTIRSNVFFF